MSNGGYDFPDLKRGIEKRRRNCGDSKLKRFICAFRPRCAGTRQRLERGVSASARGISGIAGICIVFPLIPMVGLRL
ncbi:hypothetical protein P8452_15504 [Trifolium repens]|nr:hypothetical protein P8452_15504 [Trifolium repens]